MPEKNPTRHRSSRHDCSHPTTDLGANQLVQHPGLVHAWALGLVAMLGHALARKLVPVSVLGLVALLW